MERKLQQRVVGTLVLAAIVLLIAPVLFDAEGRIPAQITQDGQSVEEVRVADGEYIMPKAQVDEYEGNGMMAKLEADRKAIVGKDMSA